MTASGCHLCLSVFCQLHTYAAGRLHTCAAGLPPLPWQSTRDLLRCANLDMHDVNIASMTGLGSAFCHKPAMLACNEAQSIIDHSHSVNVHNCCVLLGQQIAPVACGWVLSRHCCSTVINHIRDQHAAKDQTI